jgi:epoxyqueuosine reductase
LPRRCGARYSPRVPVSSPPAFAWDEWYAAVGGRSIRIPAADDLLQRIYSDQYPRFEGEIAPTRREFASPAEAAQHLKEKALEFSADIVGICEIEPSDVYRGRVVTDKYAIAVGQRMRWREFQVVPSRESAIECLRVYFTLGETVIQLASYLRSIGYACKVEHPIGDSDLLHIPIGLKAGFGELGRHGSIIHPKLGPLFRMGSVTTSLELAIDRPIDAGIAKFCDTCRACRKYCPPAAIPDERSPEAGKDHLGYDRYVVDTGRCFPYFAKYSYCSICLPVCVYNHKEWARDFEDGQPTKLFPTVLMPEPPPPTEPPESQPCHYFPRLNRR